MFLATYMAIKIGTTFDFGSYVWHFYNPMN